MKRFNFYNVCMKIFSLILAIMMITIPIYATSGMFEDEDISMNLQDTTMVGWVNSILGVIYYISMAIAVGMIIYIGIKYMSSAANERASLKGNLINYVIGAVIIFAASNVLKIIWNIITSNME